MTLIVAEGEGEKIETEEPQMSCVELRGITVLSQQTCDFLSAFSPFFSPWSCRCLIVFLG